MKKQVKSNVLFISASIVMLFVFTGVNAQRPGRMGGPGPRMHNDFPVPDSSRADRMVERMAERLDLTDDQKEEILQIHYAKIAEAHKSRKEMREIAEEHQTEMEESREEMHEKITAVLTDEQQAEFEDMRPPRRPGNFGPRGPQNRHPNQGWGRGWNDCPCR